MIAPSTQFPLLEKRMKQTQDEEQGGVTLSWNNVCFGVKSDGKDKQILKNLTGEAKAGEIVAIMGGSGIEQLI